MDTNMHELKNKFDHSSVERKRHACGIEMVSCFLAWRLRFTLLFKKDIHNCFSVALALHAVVK